MSDSLLRPSTPSNVETTEEGKPTYLDSCPELPVDAPIGHPHIIKILERSAYTKFNIKIRLADAIVTLLHQYDTKYNTKILDAFLKYDNIYQVTFNNYTDDPFSTSLELYRTDNEVTVGVLC